MIAGGSWLEVLTRGPLTTPEPLRPTMNIPDIRTDQQFADAIRELATLKRNAESPTDHACVDKLSELVRDYWHKRLPNGSKVDLHFPS